MDTHTHTHIESKVCKGQNTNSLKLITKPLNFSISLFNPFPSSLTLSLSLFLNCIWLEYKGKGLGFKERMNGFWTLSFFLSLSVHHLLKPIQFKGYQYMYNLEKGTHTHIYLLQTRIKFMITKLKLGQVNNLKWKRTIIEYLNVKF